MLRVRERGGGPVSSGRAVTAHFVAGEDDPLCTVSEIPGFNGVCSANGVWSSLGRAGLCRCG